jgi:hypothetical protein
VCDSWSYLYVERRTSSSSGCATTADQGFGICFHGKPSRAGEDFEGLALIRTKE